jgi:hypothetical protein
MHSKIPDTARNFKTGGFYIPVNRRRFFRSMALASAGFTLPGYLAEALTISPSVTQGPYYPLANNIPLDKDNDLVQLNDNLTAATGIVSYVSGRILDSSGNPIGGALVELWHADHEGDYLYSATLDGQFVCLDSHSGEQVWATEKVTELKSGASIHLTPNGDDVWLFTDEGNLIRAHLSAKGYEELSRAHLVEPTSIFFGKLLAWVPPAYANRHVFARNDKELVCASLEATP